MNDLLKQLAQQTRKLTLTREERERAHKNLVAFMKNNPVRVHPQVRLISTRSSLLALKNNIRMITTSLIIALLLGGSASYAAEGAVPGDMLYPVKIHITENVRGAVSFTDEAEASWNARRAERRLEEAERLAAEGRLESSARADIETHFKTHLANAQKAISEVEADGDIDAAVNLSSKLETALRVHDRILGELAVQKTEVQGEVKEVQDDIRAELDTILKTRVQSESKLGAQAETDARASAQASLKRAQNTIDEARERVEDEKKELSAELTTQAEGQLTIAASTLANAQAKFDAKAYNEAFMLAHRAARIAQEVKLLVETKQNLNVEIKTKNLEHIIKNERQNTSASTSVEGNVKVDDNSNVTTKSQLEIELGL